MNAFLVTTCIVTGTLLASGCATKKYVKNTAAPIQAKVDQVGEQTSRNGQQIEDTRSQVKQVDEKAQTPRPPINTPPWPINTRARP